MQAIYVLDQIIFHYYWYLCIWINKIGLTENIEKRIIITRGGISHTNACVGGVDSGNDERLCCSSGQ